MVRVNASGNSGYGITNMLKLLVNFRVSTEIIGPNGILTNLVTVTSHLIFLMIVPSILCLALLWSLLQISQIKSGVYSSVFDLGDVFMSSSYEFWYDRMEGKGYFKCLLILGVLFFSTGLIELISFYCTKHINVGKYPVVKGTLKRLTSGLFWLMIMIFFAIYVAYGSIILIWCILGAVLNPQKFLPMAIGSIVFIAFSYRLYSKLTDVHNYVMNKVNTEVDIELKESLIETMKKHQKEKKVDADSSISTTIDSFHESINNYLMTNNYAIIDSQTINKIIDGEITPLLHLISQNHGVSNNVALGILGMILENPYTILDSVHKLSDELNVNVDLNLFLTEALLNKHYLKKTAKHYRVIRPVTKKLIQVIFPNFPVIALDQMHTVITEGDLTPIENICHWLNIPSELVFIAIDLMNEDHDSLRKSVCQFKDYICKNNGINSLLFDHLEMLRNAHTEYPIDQLKDLVDSTHINRSFLLQFPIAVFKGNKSFIKNTIIGTADEFFKNCNPDLNKDLNRSIYGVKYAD